MSITSFGCLCEGIVRRNLASEFGVEFARVRVRGEVSSVGEEDVNIITNALHEHAKIGCVKIKVKTNSI